MESTWQTLPLAGCIYFQEGPGIRKNQHAKEGIPFINIRCIQQARLVREKMNCVRPDIARTLYSHFLLEADDIVVSGSGTLGKVAQVHADDLPCLSNTGIIRMRTQDPHMLDQSYLLYFLQSPLFQQQIRTFAIGSAQKNFGPTHLKQMMVHLPHLPLQQDIASLFADIDALIDSIRAASRCLRDLNRALFHHCFHKAQGKKGILKEFCSLTVRGDWGKDKPQEGLVAAYALRGIDLVQLHTEGYADAPLRWIKPQSLGKRELSECDVIIAASGAGACGHALWAERAINKLYDAPVIYSNFCKRLRAASPQAALYIAHLLQNMHENGQMQHYISGTSVPNLDIHGLLHSTITMPREEQLALYTAQVHKHSQLHYGRQLQQLQLLKQLLLQELFIS